MGGSDGWMDGAEREASAVETMTETEESRVQNNVPGVRRADFCGRG